MPINLPNGGNVDEIILPNGASASEVYGPNGDLVWQDVAIPDSVVSRPADDGDATISRSLGLVVRPSTDWPAIGFRISNMTADATRALLYDYNQSDYVRSKDISDLTAGDTETFDYELVSGQDYGIELDNNGSDWTVGFVSADYPYTSDDIDIIARSDEGEQVDSAASSVNDIGNTGFE